MHPVQIKAVLSTLYECKMLQYAESVNGGGSSSFHDDDASGGDGKGVEPVYRLKMEFGGKGELDVHNNLLKDDDDVKVRCIIIISLSAIDVKCIQVLTNF